MNGQRLFIMAAAAVIAGVLGLGWFLGVSPLLSQAATADAERTTVEMANTAQAATLATMKAQFEDIESLRADLASLRESVPGRVDADYVYTLLSGFQAATGAVVSGITTGEAVQYGVPVDAAPQEATETAVPAATGALATDLYTVPVTITFDGVPADKVLAFVKAMQTGPRLFLVTAVTGDGVSGGSSTITAFMFVVHDPALGEIPDAPAAQPVPEPTETPAPESTESPAPEESGTPTPTPTP